MTINQFERNLTTELSRTRFAAARAVYALREAVRRGESFTAARDRLLTSPPIFDALAKTRHLAAFRDLTP